MTGASPLSKKIRLDDSLLLLYLPRVPRQFLHCAGFGVLIVMREFRGSVRSWAVAMFFVACAASFAPATARAQQGPPIIRSIDVQYSGPATVAKERILAQM